jgi:hypothetical protein
MVGTTPHPDIVYATTIQKWAIVTYVAESGFPVVMTLDDDGSIVNQWTLLDSPSMDMNNIAYHHETGTIIVTTSSSVPSAKAIRIHHLDLSLSPMNNTITVSQGLGSNQNGRFGTMVALSDSPNSVQSAFLGFELSYPGLDNGNHYWMHIQRVDWDANGAASPAWSAPLSSYDGKSVFGEQKMNLGILPAIAANQDEVGIVYTRIPDPTSSSKLNDVYFGRVSSESGNPDVHYRVNESDHVALPEMAEIAHDNTEFLVTWNGTIQGNRHIYMSKAQAKDDSKLFKPIATLGPEKNHAAVPNSPGKSLVGHDGIHTFVFEEWNDPAYKSISLCIEPPY